MLCNVHSTISDNIDDIINVTQCLLLCQVTLEKADLDAVALENRSLTARNDSKAIQEQIDKAKIILDDIDEVFIS